MPPSTQVNRDFRLDHVLDGIVALIRSTTPTEVDAAAARLYARLGHLEQRERTLHRLSDILCTEVELLRGQQGTFSKLEDIVASIRMVALTKDQRRSRWRRGVGFGEGLPFKRHNRPLLEQAYYFVNLASWSIACELVWHPADVKLQYSRAHSVWWKADDLKHALRATCLRERLTPTMCALEPHFKFCQLAAEISRNLVKIRRAVQKAESMSDRQGWVDRTVNAVENLSQLVISKRLLDEPKLFVVHNVIRSLITTLKVFPAASREKAVQQVLAMFQNAQSAQISRIFVGQYSMPPTHIGYPHFPSAKERPSSERDKATLEAFDKRDLPNRKTRGLMRGSRQESSRKQGAGGVNDTKPIVKSGLVQRHHGCILRRQRIGSTISADSVPFMANWMRRLQSRIMFDMFLEGFLFRPSWVIIGRQYASSALCRHVQSRTDTRSPAAMPIPTTRNLSLATVPPELLYEIIALAVISDIDLCITSRRASDTPLDPAQATTGVGLPDVLALLSVSRQFNDVTAKVLMDALRVSRADNMSGFDGGECRQLLDRLSEIWVFPSFLEEQGGGPTEPPDPNQTLEQISGFSSPLLQAYSLTLMSAMAVRGFREMSFDGSLRRASDTSRAYAAHAASAFRTIYPMVLRKTVHRTMFQLNSHLLHIVSYFERIADIEDSRRAETNHVKVFLKNMRILELLEEFRGDDKLASSVEYQGPEGRILGTLVLDQDALAILTAYDPESGPPSKEVNKAMATLSHNIQVAFRPLAVEAAVVDADEGGVDV